MDKFLGNFCWYVVHKGLFHSVSKEDICLKKNQNKNSCKGSKGGIISNLAKMTLFQLFTARNLIFLFQTSIVPFTTIIAVHTQKGN